MTPKLLGVFADGFNDSTNILNNENINVNVIKQQAQNEIKVMNENSIKRVDFVRNEENGVNHDNSIKEMETNHLRLYPCKKLIFHTEEGNENNSQPYDYCFLNSNSNEEPLTGSQPLPSAQSPILESSSFYIPDDNEGYETVKNDSYIAIMIKVCSEPKGRVLIVDMNSPMSDSDEQQVFVPKQLFSFNNLGTSRVCNYWDTDYESIVSDSNKVRVEMSIPKDGRHDDPIKKYQFLDDSKNGGFRQIYNDNFDLDLVYFEIEFDQKNTIIEEKPSKDDREVIYKPNSVFTYILRPTPDFDGHNGKLVTKVGLEITIKHLDIDIDSGDFVLIGPGYEPTNRELSKAQLITENITETEYPNGKDIWVNADSAYIRLVTHNSNKKRTDDRALQFSWKKPREPLNETIEENVSERIKNSAIQICVMGHMCGHFDDAIRSRFIDQMTFITNHFLFKDDNNREEETRKLVSNRSVYLFGEEDNSFGQSGGKANIYCQMSLAITSAFNKQWPLVSHNTLHYIFFRGHQNRTFFFPNGTYINVTDCSQEPISFLKMILPIIVILIVSIIILFIAWRYQYHNWTHLQKQNANYMKAQVNDANEDDLNGKDNPIFMDDDHHLTPNKGRTIETTRSIDSMDGRPSEHKPLSKQLSYTSSTSSKKLASVKESPEFVKKLWLSPPGTSHQQNEYVFDDISISDEKSDGSPTPNQTINDNSNKANTYSQSMGDTLKAQITGLNGTQHESLRSYPRSALRRPTIVENEDPIEPSDGTRRPSKVQFELPIKPNVNKIINNCDYESNERNNE